MNRLEQQKLSESQYLSRDSQFLDPNAENMFCEEDMNDEHKRSNSVGEQEFLEEQNGNHILAASGFGGRSPSPESVSEEYSFPSHSSVASSDSPMLDEHCMKKQLRMENIEEGECGLSNGNSTDDLKNILVHKSKTSTPDRADSIELEFNGSHSSENQQEQNNESKCHSPENVFSQDYRIEKRRASVAEQDCLEQDDDHIFAASASTYNGNIVDVDTDDLEPILAHHSKTPTPSRAASIALDLKGSHPYEEQKEDIQSNCLSRWRQFIVQSTEDLFSEDCSKSRASVEQECLEVDDDFSSASASCEETSCNQSPIFDQDENSGIQELTGSNLGGNNMDVVSDALTFEGPNTSASPSRSTSIGCESECSIHIEDEQEQNNDGEASPEITDNSFCSSASPKSGSDWTGDGSSDVSEFSGCSANSIDLSDFENRKSSLLVTLFSILDGPTYQELLNVMHVCEFTLQTKKEKKNENLRAKLSQAEKENKQLTSQLNESKSVIRMLEEQCNDKTKSKEQTSENVKLQNEIRILKVNLKDATTCLKQRNNNLSAIKSDLAATNDSLEKMNTTCEMLSKELKLANNSLSEAKWEAEIQKDMHCREIQDFKEELNIVCREKDELAVNLLRLEERVKNENKAKGKLQLEKNQAVALCHELQKNWHHCREDLDQELTVVAAREQDIQNLKKENNKTMAELRQVKHDLQQALSKVSVLEGTLKNNTSQHKAIEVEKAELIKTVDKLKREVESETNRADQNKEEKDHLDILFKQELLKTRECKKKNQKLYGLAHSRKNKLKDQKVLDAEMGEIKEKVSMLHSELTKEKAMRSQLEEDSRNLKEQKEELEDNTRQRDKEFHVLFKRLQQAEQHFHSQSEENQEKKKDREDIVHYYENMLKNYEKKITMLNEAYNSSNKKNNEYSELYKQKQDRCVELERQLRIALNTTHYT